MIYKLASYKRKENEDVDAIHLLSSFAQILRMLGRETGWRKHIVEHISILAYVPLISNRSQLPPLLFLTVVNCRTLLPIYQISPAYCQMGDFNETSQAVLNVLKRK